MDSYIVNFLSLGHSFESLALTLLQEKKKETFPNKKLKDIDKIVPSKGTSFDESLFITYFDELSLFLDREWVHRHPGRSLEIVN